MTTITTLDQRIRDRAVKERETVVLNALRKLIREACGPGLVRLTTTNSDSADVIRPGRGWLITQLMEQWRENNTVEIGDKAVRLFLNDYETMAEQIQDNETLAKKKYRCHWR